MKYAELKFPLSMPKERLEVVNTEGVVITEGEILTEIRTEKRGLLNVLFVKNVSCLIGSIKENRLKIIQSKTLTKVCM